eukprot:3806160-Pleurochrysis_carterae.AAC.2
MIVYQDFRNGARGAPEFGACAPRLGTEAVSPPERARAEAVVCSADTVGVSNNDVVIPSCVGLGVCGERPCFAPCSGVVSRPCAAIGGGILRSSLLALVVDRVVRHGRHRRIDGHESQPEAVDVNRPIPIVHRHKCRRDR